MGALISIQQQRALEREFESMFDEVETDLPYQVRFQPQEQVRDFMQPDPLSLEGIPPYPGATPRKLSSSATVQGTPMASAWFTTEDPVDEVLSFYDGAFLPLDTIRVSHRYSERVGYSGFYEIPNPDAGVDFMSGRVHLVSAVRSGSRTMVFLSNTQPETFLAASRTPIGGIEFPEGSRSPQVLVIGEGEMKKHTAFAVVPNRHMDNVREHFDSVLPRAGWTLKEWTHEADGAVRGTAVRQGRNATITLLKDGLVGTKVLLGVDDFATNLKHLELQP